MMVEKIQVKVQMRTKAAKTRAGPPLLRALPEPTKYAVPMHPVRLRRQSRSSRQTERQMPGDEVFSYLRGQSCRDASA